MHHEIASSLTEAFSAYNEGNYEKCISLSKKVMMLDDGNIDAQNMIAVSAHRLKKYEDAVNSIMCVAAHNIDKDINIVNFSEIIRNALSHIQNITDDEEKKKVIISCYKAVHFSMMHKGKFNVDIAFPILVKNMIDIGYQQEAINISRASFKATSHSEIPLMCTHIMLDLGIIDEECLRNSANLGVKFIRENKNMDFSFSAVLYWCYWKKKFKSMNFFLNLMKKKLNQNTIIKSKILHAWNMTIIDREFYANKIYKFNYVINYKKNHIASQIEGKNVVLISVDDNYWNRFARQMTEDLLLKSRSFPVHVCIMNASAETLSSLSEWEKKQPRLGYSIIDTDDQRWISSTNKQFFRKTYFACNRFMITEDILDIYKKPIISLDGDQVPLGNMDEFVEKLLECHDGDIAIHYGTRLGPGREMVCDLAVFRPTPATHLFFSLLKRYMGYFLSQDYALWTLDQVSFYAVLSFLQISRMSPRLSLIEQEKFHFDRYLFHPLDSTDKDALIRTKRATLATEEGK